jgi:uncharacterized protein (DUF934 family)
MSIIVTDSGFSSPDIEDSATTHNPRATIDLPSDFDPTQITPELLRARCIRIELPSFADGRGFTLATLLRLRGYNGHLRAFGHVLADQYAMARRCGFDDVQISDELAARQPEAQWQHRADWRAHDYQARLRQPAA